MSARVLCRTGELAGLTHDVERQSTIGRVGSNEIVLNTPMISKRHARIYRVDEDYFLEDLGSRNGTSLDGEPVAEPVKLGKLHVISFADFDFVFVRSADERAGFGSARGEAGEEVAASGVVAIPDPPDPGRAQETAGPPPAQPPSRVETPAERQPGQPEYYLEIRFADDTTAVHPLEEGRNMLGRADECDVTISEGWLSRQHAVVWVGSEVVLEDLASENGTFLRDERIERTPIEAGDVFALGPTIRVKLMRR